MLLKIIFIDSLTKNKGWVDFKYLVFLRIKVNHELEANR